ncbi:MAG: hypothetical protein Q4D93_03165 [Porphyromonas sp.]|nr:hypothetical protein [Porphyromonas sp.]
MTNNKRKEAILDSKEKNHDENPIEGKGEKDVALPSSSSEHQESVPMGELDPEDQFKQSPVVSYMHKANEIRDETNRVEDIVDFENKGFARHTVSPDYQDDPSSIDLEDLRNLRIAIQKMTRELSTVRRSNVYLQRMIQDLRKEHEDAINRVSYTDLWKRESKQWSRDFEEAYRSYETAKAKALRDLPPKASEPSSN